MGPHSSQYSLFPPLWSPCSSSVHTDRCAVWSLMPVFSDLLFRSSQPDILFCFPPQSTAHSTATWCFPLSHSQFSLDTLVIVVQLFLLPLSTGLETTFPISPNSFQQAFFILRRHSNPYPHPLCPLNGRQGLTGLLPLLSLCQLPQGGGERKTSPWSCSFAASIWDQATNT